MALLSSIHVVGQEIQTRGTYTSEVAVRLTESDTLAPAPHRIFNLVDSTITSK